MPQGVLVRGNRMKSHRCNKSLKTKMSIREDKDNWHKDW